MKQRIKSWKTTIIGIIALMGLGYKAYTSGGFEVSDFLLLAVGVGFIGSKDKVIGFKAPKTVDGEIPEKPDTRG
jgi:hypothetical protein